MAKREKYYIARYVETNPGGGVSMTGFVEFKDEVQRMPNGATRLLKAKVPTSITVKATPGDSGQEIKYGKEDIFLEQGEFIVQNNPINVALLKRKCKIGQIQMTDWDLHYEFIEQEAPAQFEEIEMEETHVEYDITPSGNLEAAKNKAAEKRAVVQQAPPTKDEEEMGGAFGDLTNINCLKIKRTEVLQGLMAAGITSMELLSRTQYDDLRKVSGIGPKMAEGMLEEANSFMLKE